MARNPNKKAKFGVAIEGRKEAKIAVPSFSDRKAAWRINRVQMVDPYGWHGLTVEEVRYIQGKLSEYEKKTWNEIFTKEKHWNHSVYVTDLVCDKAKKWMRENMKDQNEIWTLRLSGAERVWGVLSEGVFLVIFWDPEHLIWKTPKK